MSVFYRILAVWLLAIWVPTTSHCYLEDAGLWEIALDNCCATDSDSSESHSDPSHNEDPCDTGCKLVEKTGYKFNEDTKLIRPAFFVVLTPLTLPQFTLVAPCDSIVHSWPPETLHLTQFVSRTALPPRAPSFVS